MDLRDRICNLCLVKCEEFKSIEGNRKIVLSILLPSVEFTDFQGTVMCKKCEEVLKKCFDFKATCLRSFDYVVPFVKSQDAVKLDIKDVYLTKNVTNAGVSECQGVCGFCMNLVENCYAVSVDVGIVEEGNFILEKMIEQCLPELDLSIIKNPIICSDCHRSLEIFFRFVTNCLTAQEKIKRYPENINRDSKDKIEISGLLHSTMRTVEASDINGDTVEVIKAEKQFCVKIENPKENTIGDVIKLEQMSCDDSEYVNDIRNENFMLSDNQKVDSEQMFTPKCIYACAEEDNLLVTIKIEETFSGENENVEMDDQKCILTEDIEIKSEEHDFNSFQSDSSKRVTSDDFLKDRKYTELGHHLSDSLKVTIYQCDSCPYQTKRKDCLKRHLLVHEDTSEIIHKCESCPFETKHKRSLMNHSWIHKDPSIVTRYQCDSCPFQTNLNSILKNHLLVHKDPSEVKYKCESCPYQAKHKRNLVRDSLIHKDPSEVTMYRCEFCPYQTKFKHLVDSHLLVHKDSSEIIMYKCESCPFQTKRKHTLKLHSLVHKYPSKLSTYRCESCPYQAKRKDVLQSHLLIHKLRSNVTMYRCDSCPFQAKHKYILNNHLRVHKDTTEVIMYKCESCLFQTKYRGNLTRHSLVHKDP